MTKSFICLSPTTDHRKQFVTVANVKGKGMDSADLVAITVFIATSGLAKRNIQNSTAAFPITWAVLSLENTAAVHSAVAIAVRAARMCRNTGPGNVLDSLSAYFMNSRKYSVLNPKPTPFATMTEGSSLRTPYMAQRAELNNH